jgi:hypothetical protein
MATISSPPHDANVAINTVRVLAYGLLAFLGQYRIVLIFLFDQRRHGEQGQQRASWCTYGYGSNFLLEPPCLALIMLTSHLKLLFASFN